MTRWKLRLSMADTKHNRFFNQALRLADGMGTRVNVSNLNNYETRSIQSPLSQQEDGRQL
uniref:Uncharacterized protein n=1 Tax=Nelumbo nucifera TaxID=4432 RepID=A0A822ZTX1_NELNU|nr:TPA_asm: hypothetical protein HUJ06_018264 [Nelumbo nucifera]